VTRAPRRAPPPEGEKTRQGYLLCAETGQPHPGWGSGAHHRILSPLLLYLLVVAAPAAGSTQASQGVQCRWPVGHLAAYDFTMPAQIAAIVPGGRHRKARPVLRKNLRDPALVQLRRPGNERHVLNVPAGGGPDPRTEREGRHHDRGLVLGVVLGHVRTASASGVLLPESINADGTVNRKFELHLNRGQNPNPSFSTTGLLAPSNGHLAPVTVHLKPDGSRLRIT